MKESVVSENVNAISISIFKRPEGNSKIQLCIVIISILFQLTCPPNTHAADTVCDSFGPLASQVSRLTVNLT